MVAYPFRMPAGFAGDVSRTHPMSIFPAAADTTAPPTEFGVGLIVNRATNGLRMVGPADYAAANTAGFLRINGVLVRPFPYQQPTTSNYGAAAFGAGVPPSVQPLDVMTFGCIMVAIPQGQAPQKDDPVYLWAAATSGGGRTVAGGHTQGGFETAVVAGSTVLVQGARFNGPPDANGICELILRDAA